MELNRTCKNVIYQQLPFIYKLKLYVLFIKEKMRLPFIVSDLFYRGALSGRFEYKIKFKKYIIQNSSATRPNSEMEESYPRSSIQMNLH